MLKPHSVYGDDRLAMRNPAKSILLALLMTIAVMSRAASSDPLETWTQVPVSTHPFGRVVYCGDRFIALGTGEILVSADGKSWSPQIVPDESGLRFTDAVWGAGRFILVGGTTCPDRFFGWISTNTVDWAPITAGGLGIVFGNGQFVLVGGSAFGGAKIATSPDGLTWTDHNPPIFGSLRTVAYGNGKYVAAGGEYCLGYRGGVILSSTNGTDWTSHKLANVPGSRYGGYIFNSVVFGNGRFIATGVSDGDLDLYAVSLDGETWQTAEGLYQGMRNSVTYGCGLFAASGPVGMVNSGNGVTWLSLASPHGYVAFGQNTLVVLDSYHSMIYQSSDLRSRFLTEGISVLPQGIFQVDLQAVTGSCVSVETSTNMAQWIVVTNWITTQPTVRFIHRPLDSQPNHYYRAINP